MSAKQKSAPNAEHPSPTAVVNGEGPAPALPSPKILNFSGYEWTAAAGPIFHAGSRNFFDLRLAVSQPNDTARPRTGQSRCKLRNDDAEKWPSKYPAKTRATRKATQPVDLKKVAQETGCGWTKAVSSRPLVHLKDPEVFR
jgi:hypothetical protein